MTFDLELERMNKPLISFIIPVYNRPQEVDELLMSMTKQEIRDFEIIIVEDGSSLPCYSVVSKYIDSLSIKYIDKSNSGPSDSRNKGSEQAIGEYLIFLDSDCVLPIGYINSVVTALSSNNIDAFGGPDRADSSFSPIQKAINYSMTSFFTTGGIRGGKKKMDKFYPRSFNLGIKRSVFNTLGGFSAMRFGEDIDLSIRIYKAGYKCVLLSESWVYHKRRTDFNKFFKQVYNSGIARIVLFNKYPESLKLVHFLPALFTTFVALSILLSLFNIYAILPLLVYCILILINSLILNKNLKVALLSVIASFVQLIGYGSGFILAWWKLKVLGHGKFSAFEKTFYD